MIVLYVYIVMKKKKNFKELIFFEKYRMLLLFLLKFF